MKELNRTDRLTIAAIIFGIIIIIGLFTIKKPEVHFTRSAEETINILLASNDVMTATEVKILSEQPGSNYSLVDLRSPVDFRRAHIGNAKNIPVQELFSPESLKFFEETLKENTVVILYGHDQLEANGAWMLLKQTGFDHIRVLSGGYDNLDKASFRAEDPAVDYKAVLDSLGSPAAAGSEIKKPESLRIIKREKKSVAEGGC